jgi:hypothetical protein
MLAPVGFTAPGQFSVSETAAPGFVYQFQCSSNLVNWVVVSTVTNSTGTVTFVDPNAGTGARFYRVLKLP